MAKPPPGERPTLQQMAQEGHPWGCPKCECHRTRVVNTYNAQGHINRRRVCGNCGTPLLRTQEHDVPNGHHVEIVPNRKVIVPPDDPWEDEEDDYEDPIVD